MTREEQVEQAALEGSAELRRALEFNRAVMANMAEGLYTVDTQGLVTYINPAAERLFGWSSAELLGRKMHDMTHYQHPDGRPFPASECSGLQVLQRGLILSNHEDVFIRKDKTFFPVIYSASPIRSDGAIIGLVVVFRDISAQKEAEAEIRRHTNWLERLIATTQDAVISIDRQARIVLFNPGAERIFGYTRNEIVGQKVNLLMAEPYATEHDGYIERYEKTGEARAIGRIRTVTAKRKNGELFPIELSVTEIEVDDDLHYAAFIRDISEKARLQAQLVENERLVAIGTTAAKIGHELANPLNGMSLTIQLLEQRLRKQSNLLDTQITSTVNRLHTEVSRLSTLLEQFRSLSRREKFDFQRTTLTALVGEAIEIEMPRYAKLGIQVECSFPSNLPTITVDINKMKQVIFNLTKNAAEAMAGGGRISIKGSASENSIVLEISDTGTGIPAGIDIFEPFFTTKPEGTGIGLSIVQQIVSAHGGSITYRSEHGKGTTFVISLPQK